METTRQRFSLLNGLVSMTFTLSPIRHSSISSWAFNLVVRRMVFPNSGCLTSLSTATTTVLFILSLTTIPTRVLRCARSSIAGFQPPSFLLLGFDLCLPFPEDRFYPGQIFPDHPYPPVIIQLPGGQLKTEVKKFRLEISSFLL